MLELKVSNLLVDLIHDALHGAALMLAVEADEGPQHQNYYQQLQEAVGRVPVPSLLVLLPSLRLNLIG